MIRFEKHRRLTATTALAVVLVACGGGQNNTQARAPAQARPVSTTKLTSATVQEAPKPVSPGLAVSEEILRACAMKLENVESAPKFEFDESDLLPQDFEVLQKIATCFTTGPLAGRKMQLVGRADPRGATEYNMVLGARRAATVSSYLSGLGVDLSNMMVTSRGELDATGIDEAGWRLDRRVDVLLVPVE